MAHARRWVAFAVGCSLGLLTTSSSDADPRPTCLNPISSEVHALYQRWIDALATGNAATVTRLYSNDAIVMGIGAGSISLGQREIETYYGEFLRRRPVIENTNRSIYTACGGATDTGLQLVALRPKDGLSGARTVQARYTITYAAFGPEWLIVHHHAELLADVPVTTLLGSMMSTSAMTPRPGQDDAAPNAIALVLPAPGYVLPTSPPVILPNLRFKLAPQMPTEPANAPVPVSVPTVVAAPTRAAATMALPSLPASVLAPPTMPVVAAQRAPEVAAPVHNALPHKTVEITKVARPTVAAPVVLAAAKPTREALPKPARLQGPTPQKTRAKAKAVAATPDPYAFKAGRWEADGPVFD